MQWGLLPLGFIWNFALLLDFGNPLHKGHYTSFIQSDDDHVDRRDVSKLRVSSIHICLQKILVHLHSKKLTAYLQRWLLLTRDQNTSLCGLFLCQCLLWSYCENSSMENDAMSNLWSSQNSQAVPWSPQLYVVNRMSECYLEDPLFLWSCSKIRTTGTNMPASYEAILRVLSHVQENSLLLTSILRWCMLHECPRSATRATERKCLPKA